MEPTKTCELLYEMDAVLLTIRDVPRRMVIDAVCLSDAWDALSEPTFFEADHTLATRFTSAIDDACERVDLITGDLKTFDEQLAKLIKLRGELAEELGVPVMSHVTGGRWTRTEEHSM